MAADANLTMEQFISMETTIQATWKSAGDALRIKFQAMPQVGVLRGAGDALRIKFQAMPQVWG